MSILLFSLWLTMIKCEKIKAMDTLKYRNIEKKACHFRLCKLWTQWHHMGWTKIIDKWAISFRLHCVLLGCFASFLSRPYNDHSYTTNATMRQDMASRNSSGVVTELLSSFSPYMRLDLCSFSVTGSFPPCGSLNSTCLTHLWISPTLFIFLDKVTLEFLAKLSSDSNLHNLTANNRMPVFENKRLYLQDIWRWILKKCYL